MRHTDQWRFGVFWQDDGPGSGNAGTGSNASANTGNTSGGPSATGLGAAADAAAAAAGYGGIGTAPSTGPGSAPGPSVGDAPSFGGSFGGGTPGGFGASVSFGGGGPATGTAGTAPGPGTAGGPAGGGGGTAGGASGGGGTAASGFGGAATGGGGGTAAGGSASGPGLANIAQAFFSSIMGSPANAKSLYGDPGSAAAYMNPGQIQAINHQLAQGQPSSPAFGNLGVQSLIDALSNSLGGGLGNVAQQSPSPALGSLALAIALGDTFGALGGEAPGGDSPGYGFTTTMGYPAQNPTIGIGGAPQGTPAPVGAPFGGAISAPSVRGPGSDASAPVSTYGDLGGGPAGQNTTGMPIGPGGSEVAGGMPTSLDFGDNVAPPAPPSDVVGPPAPSSLQGMPADVQSTVTTLMTANPTMSLDTAYSIALALHVWGGGYGEGQIQGNTNHSLADEYNAVTGPTDYPGSPAMPNSYQQVPASGAPAGGQPI